MNESTKFDDQAFIAEALRRMKSKKPGIPGQKVQEFLNKLEEEWDRAGDMSQERIQEMFQSFVAEAAHVPG